MKRIVMRGTIAAGLLSAVILAAMASAVPRAVAMENGWCAVTNTGSENCGFMSMAQCSAAVSGFGGFCRMSPYGAASQRRAN